MKKLVMLLITVFIFVQTVLSQVNQKTQDATFCGKIGEDGPSGGNYTIQELQNCDWQIIPVDTGFTVTEFRMSLVPNDNTYKYSEIPIKGNFIPEQYRNQILSHSRMVLLEFIKAANYKGESILVKAIAVRITT